MPIIKDKEWQVESQKWEDGKLDLDNTTIEDLNRYVQFKTVWYTAIELLDFSLWEIYKEDFQDFTVDTFKAITSVYLQKLRNCLIHRGVWINTNYRNKTLTQSLYDIVQEEDQTEWTREMIDFTLQKFGNTLSRAVQRCIDVGTLEEQRQGKDKDKASVQDNLQDNPQIEPSLQSLPELLPDIKPEPTFGYARQITTMAKLYTDEQRYSGVNDSFDYKLSIFHDICSRTDVPQEAYAKAFPTMLKGLALDQFYTSKLSTLSFPQICSHIRNFFEGPGYQRKNLDEWNSITLQTIIATNPEKSTTDCLQLLINKLRQLQHSLALPLRITEFLHNKLITCCQGVPACRYAVSDPPETLGPLINKLQSSIIAYDKEQGEAKNQTYFTDRQYHKRPDTDRQYQKRPDNRDYGRNHSQDRLVRRCFVCNKEGCWSWKHTEQEQEESKTRFKSKLKSQVNGNSRRFDNRFQERIKQYIIDYEGDDDDSEDEFNNAFNTLVIDTDIGSNLDNDDDNTMAYFTSYGTVQSDVALPTAKELANRACNHAISASDPTIKTPSDNDPFIYTVTSRYASSKFMGILVDTGASARSTAGYGQFLALQKISNIQLDKSTKGKVDVQFGIGSSSSIGSIHLDTPIGLVEFHVVEVDTPLLLCLADMDKLKVYFNNLKNVLVTPNTTIPVVRRFGHPFLLWDTSLQTFLVESFDYNPCYLTDVELRRLHRRFGHPSVNRLKAILDRSGHGNDNDRTILEYITRYCSHCQKHGRSPGRFRFTLKDDVSFNCSIIVDIMYINGQPLLHIVDEGTRFQAGRWLQDITIKHTWDMLRTCWIDTYLGPPDTIVHDAGKNFVSKEFKQYAINIGTATKGVPVEAHNSIGMVERYHGLLRRIYNIITAEVPGIDKDIALQMAFKALNDSAGPDGLVPTLLVFGAYPRLAESDVPAPTVTQRANALKKAMDEIKKIQADRQITDALRLRNGPVTSAIYDLLLNSEVLVWREGNTGQPGQWTGPYILLNIENQSCTVSLPNGPTNFRITMVKPYQKEDNQRISEDDTGNQNQDLQQAIIGPQLSPRPDSQPSLQSRRRGRPRKYPLYANTADITVYLQDNTQFQDSRQKEINGLLEKDVFELVDPQKVPKGVRIFNSRFVDEIKNKGTDKAFEKSRLVVQAYNDLDKGIVLTQSPTIQRVSQRLILCIAAIKQDSNIRLYLRDISQAYVQSITKLNRNFYIRPPPELSIGLGLGKDSVLKVVKPLYGVPETGNHWFKTYHAHHIKELEMDQSTYDSCLLWSNTPDRFGIVGLQTDDTLFLANKVFAASEQERLDKAQFLAKERECLTIDQPLKFNGCIIRLDQDGNITITQERQCQNLATVDSKAATTTSSRGTIRKALTTKEQYVAQRARGAYIASVCQPEASYDLSVAAQVTNPSREDVATLNKRLQWQIDNPLRGLKFVKLDINSLRLYVFTDASFANNKDLSSQIGYILVLADASNKANIIHWSSIKCKRVTRSVLASELYAMAHGFDIGAVIKSTTQHLLQTDIPLVLCTDSKSLYECLVKLGTTTEKRLMIDIMCLRQSYERREITEVKWIDGESNPADSMTKDKTNTALKRLIDTNRLELKVMEWVERTAERN